MAMFQSEENNEQEYEMTMEAETVIGSSVKLDGDFFSENDTVIHGHVSGKVVVGGDLTLGGTSVVKANVSGENIVIAGKVQGDVAARQKLTLLGTAAVEGNIQASRLEISEGALLNGQCSMSATPAHGEGEEDQHDSDES